ncbi:exported hypothetical protein [Flavobacterium sp. 9AF]|uniref:hypothetical protein n=1 Tax=Flavobacterium sp. 9AF TaxID=2653142 RepID=UPI0012F2342E|nr:hypothetical protein [Flavobacterium sp. 9AF]VXB14068.1 exported hypothetical protein [Flavobacterium sp. 9AF]
MKKILITAIILLFINMVFAHKNNPKENGVEKKNVKTDICSITYIVKEKIGAQTLVSEYTFTATTCEQVENAAIAAGIIKPKVAKVE